MKRLLMAVLLLSSTHTVYAENEWVGPALLGGAVAGVVGSIFQSNRVYIMQPMPVYAPPVVIYYTPPLTQPTPAYQYQWVYDQTCFCTRQILVRLN